MHCIFACKCWFHLGFLNDFNGHLLAFHISFLHFRNISVPKMPSPNLNSKFIFISEMFGESEVLVERGDNFATFRDGRRVRLHRAMPPRQRRPYMLRRRRWWKRPFEKPARRDREHVAPRTRTVEREKRRSLRVLRFAIG